MILFPRYFLLTQSQVNTNIREIHMIKSRGFEILSETFKYKNKLTLVRR